MVVSLYFQSILSFFQIFQKLGGVRFWIRSKYVCVSPCVTKKDERLFVLKLVKFFLFTFSPL